MTTRRSVNFDDIADQYDKRRGGEERGRRFADDLARHLPDAGMTLDVGGGTGTIALGLAQRGHRVVCVDIAERMLAYAKARLGSWVARADATQLPFSSESFESAYAVWVLHHVSDPGRALAEAARVLRPGGRFLAMARSAEAGEATDAISDVLRGLPSGFPRPGPGGQGVEPFARLAPSCGFRVLGTEQAGPYPIEESPADIARMIQMRTPAMTDDVRSVVERLGSLGDETVQRLDYEEILILERTDAPS